MNAEKEPRKRRKRAAEAPAGNPPALNGEPIDRPAFPVVGIGASAGGVAAFEGFFAAMPAEDEGLGMSFVLVQHLSPDHKSMLVEILQRHTRMLVREAEHELQVQPCTVYIIPPGHDLTIQHDGSLHLREHDDRHQPHLTIDHFFTSLAAVQGERAVGIVMSGTGSDGTLGLREIKSEGGLVMVQAPETTEFSSMPRSAISTGMVDYILPPEQMPGQLIAYVRHAFDPVRRPTPASLRDALLKKICALLQKQTGHDFAQYKDTTLLRRIERRMALHQIVLAEDYLRYARDNPQEVEALFRDLLIGVTHFFRDPDAFHLLSEKVISRIVANKAANETVRIWVCACSTGEEAYSIAILLHEHMRAANRLLNVQVFATDIDRQAIDRARGGLYPASIAAHVSEERLGRFFTHDPQRGTYLIQKHIRDMLVFAEQDVIKDPLFSRLDLISCRNLLIYLMGDLQRKLIPLFHYALAPGGALFLGTSETVGDSARLFQVVDRKWKIYLRLAGDKPVGRTGPPVVTPPFLALGERRQGALAGEEDLGTLREITERALLAHYGQSALLVDARGKILHILGRTGKYLEPADGDANLNIIAMAREGLRRDLTNALHKSVARRELVSCPAVKVKTNGDPISVNLAVRPVDGGGGSVVYLVILEEMSTRPAPELPLAGADYEGRVSELDRELRAKDEYLQTTLEEMDTSNEELKSANEEMQSINEELQSTNEELETSKEEMQAVNEELSTVNGELQDKIADLVRANNDTDNLLAGTGVGTVFVDHQLRITRFTPAATPVINLIANDIGRPLEHVASNLVGYNRMIEDLGDVLDTLAPKEAEVQVKGGAWYLMRMRPYRTRNNLIEGAVLTLVDISERREAEASLRLSEAREKALIAEAYAGVSAIDLDGRFQFADDRLCKTLGYSLEELLGKRLADLTSAEDLPRLRELYEELAAGGPDIQLTRCYLHKDGGRIHLFERVSAIRDAGGRARTLLSLAFLLGQTTDSGQTAIALPAPGMG